MRLRYKSLVPGAMLVYKNYPFIKKWIYKLLRKELPYNCVTIFPHKVDLYDTFSSNSDTYLLQPNIKYSDKTRTSLEEALRRYVDNGESFSVDFTEKTIKDLVSIMNKVRPGTFRRDTKIEDLISNKNFNSKRISEEEDWNVYIY